MARIKKTPKRYRSKRRAYRKKRYYKRRMLSMSKAPMPNKFATKLRYAESFQIDPQAGGTTGVHLFSCNGLYDPNYTGTGHQPRGFDQFMEMYDHYTVIGSKMTAIFSSVGIAGAGGPLMVGIALKDSTTAPSDKNEYMEGRNVKSGLLKRSVDTGFAYSVKLKKSFSTRKFLGFSHPLSVTEARGSRNLNPIEQAYFHLFAQIVTGTADAPVIECQVVIDYLVVFTEPKQPPQS